MILFTCLSFAVMGAAKEQVVAATPHPLQDLLPLSILPFLVVQGQGGERIRISSSWIWIGNVDGS